MNLAEIEQNVAELDVSQGFDLVYDLLRAYGIPKASISRLKKGTHDRSENDNEHLWRGKLYYRFIEDGSDLHVLIDDAKNDQRVTKERPRFLIVRDDQRLVAIDTKVETTLDIDLSELPAHAAFFLPWAGIEKTQLEALNYADIKAAEKMARLYDEITKHNAITTEADVHHLNVFFSRLLFCFFAEDTGVFCKGSFTNALASLTLETGEDTGDFLDTLFKLLNTKESQRAGVPAHLKDFGYVNGKLFDQKAPSPQFSPKARKIILECGTLDWSQINPDIFGSMIQAVVHPGQRESLGMHYTSVENIMKVIRPLFLDDLEAVFEEATDSVRKLERLLDRISKIQVFDPACGSGNFLVISYKELRKLEHRILQRLSDLQVADQSKAYLFKESVIKLENFYGIEIDDFAHEIAILSLWLAKHQMNVQFKELFGVEISLIPLRDTGNIACENAARIDWSDVCPETPNEEIYVLGNPPYQGGTLQSTQQKEDLALAFKDESVNKYLDYVSIWLYKGARFIESRHAQLGFVATNSVCQGNSVGLLWSRMKDTKTEISFAHMPFRWSNSAKANAGVTCVIIGLSKPGERPIKTLYADGLKREASTINSYLLPDAKDVIVLAADRNRSGLPPMVFGSMPRDGGHLLLEPWVRDEIISNWPEANQIIRRFVGASSLMRGTVRYCLWIPDDLRTVAERIPPIKDRLDRVRAFRQASKAASTRRFAESPHRFVQCAHVDAPAIIIPRHTSERRAYIPMDFLDPSMIVADSAMAIYGAEPWLLGLLQSRMHMVWVRAVGGRIKSDMRYSAELCYNTFPSPQLSDSAETLLTQRVLEILEVREHFADKALGELYNPDQMPQSLINAHRRLDEVVEALYRRQPFSSEDDRLAFLFERYSRMSQTLNGDAIA